MRTITLIVLVLSMASCGVQKKILRQQIEKDSLKIEKQQREIYQRDSTIISLNKKIEESSEETVVFQDRCDTAALKRILSSGGCPEAVIDSFINRLIAQDQQIEILADGTKRFRGAIKEYKMKTSKLIEENSLLKSETERLSKENLFLKSKNTESQTIKTREVIKYSIPTWMIILLIFLVVLSIFIYYKRKIPFL